jgi:4-phytase/acid phosphatase
MKIMGRFYRDYFSSQGLLGKAGCKDAGLSYLWADTDQRTMETGRALAEGLFPGCPVEVHSKGEGEEDPLFNPIAVGVAKPDSKLAVAAVAGRLGPQPDALTGAYRPAFDLLTGVLNGSGKAARSIMDEPVELSAGDEGAAMSGPLRLASTLTENLLLEYTNGMSGETFAWGGLSPAGLQQVMILHTTYAELMRRTPYLARARGSNLLSHVVRSLEQAAGGKPVQGSIGTPETTLLVISGHDTNISNLSSLLGMSWVLPGYQPDDAPPGGALIFSLWHSSTTGRYSVRVQFIAQSLQQMHEAAPLSRANPPVIADIFLPACSTAAEGYPCDWANFQRTAKEAIAPEFVEASGR